MWDTSCLDWEERILAGRSLVPTLPLFRDAKGEIAGTRVFKRLHIPDIPGQPTFGVAAGQWLIDIVDALFGSLDVKAHRRMIQEVFLLVPKKNSKSSGAAGVMLSACIVSRRPNDEGTYLAPTKEIADIAFGQTEGMIKADPELTKAFHIQKHVRTITNRANDCVIKVKAADTDAVTGLKGSFALVDETHEFARKPRAADVFLELRGALASRPDGFLLQVTTQSKTPPTGVFATELQTARAVRDGKLQLPLLPILHELPKAVVKQWRDHRYWSCINPNLGRSVDLTFLENGLRKAESENEAAVQLFASQHFNVEIGVGLKSDGWAGAEYWEQGTEEGLDLETVLERSEVCTIGIDGGGLDDLLGVCVLGRERSSRRWLAWNHAFISPEGMKRREANASTYQLFMSDGDLTLVDELPDDIEKLVEVVERVKMAKLLGMVGVDSIGLPAMVEALARIGVTSDSGLLIGVAQGIGMMGSIKAIERGLVDGSFKHGGSRLMAWCAGNAKLVATATASRIARDVSGYGKIDPLMALFDAADAMARNPKVSAPDPYYMKHGLLVLSA